MRPPEPCVRRHHRLLRGIRGVPRTPAATGVLSAPRLPWAPHLLWALGLLSVMGPLSVLSLPAAVGLPSAGTVSGGAWQWPLLPRPQVIAAFAAPADPYGPGARGVDLAATVGQPVHSAAAGTVAFAGLVAGTPVVTVDHGAVVTTYEPVVSGVRAGQRVPAGGPVGTVAALPRRCGVRTCLHWGAYRKGSAPRSYLDPLALLHSGPVRLLPDTPGSPLPDLIGAVPGTAARSAVQHTASARAAAAERPAPTASASAAGMAGGGTATAAAGTTGGRRTHRLTVAATVAVLVSGSVLLAPVLVGAGPTGRPGRGGARRGPSAGPGARGQDR